ncbi:hypothetical protein CDAR_181471 [Caerostris darwini]|uniref:Uncharacterized protein n=1 Tax=Caerostris darwini TaxID=1538125 RepID=A0AAV4U3W2_9ARAC|nr:hypothetical protein CDAR_181471 [Caerostris darwini]
MCCVGSWCRPSFYTSPRGISVDSAMMDDTQGSKYHSTKRDEHKKRRHRRTSRKQKQKRQTIQGPETNESSLANHSTFCLVGRGRA